MQQNTKTKYKVIIETMVPTKFIYHIEASSPEEAEILASKKQVAPVKIIHEDNRRKLLFCFITKILSDIKVFTRRYV